MSIGRVILSFKFLAIFSSALKPTMLQALLRQNFFDACDMFISGFNSHNISSHRKHIKPNRVPEAWGVESNATLKQKKAHTKTKVETTSRASSVSSHVEK